ncbi:MAG: hypothetical protein V1728_00535 [Candidatus Micrarchaeota archaeon]
MASFMRAQGSSEYLVLMGTVLVVALASVAILFSSQPPASGARNGQSAQYWSSVAAPLQISDWVLKTPSGGGASDLWITLFNPTSRSYIVRKLSLSEGNFANAFWPDGTLIGGTTTMSITLAPGERKTIDLRSDSAYVPPANYQIGLNITYDGSLPGALEAGKAPLVGQTSVY